MNRRLFLASSLLVPPALSGCLFDGKLKHDFGVVPEQLDDGWSIGTPASVGLSSDALARIHGVLLDEDRFPGSLGLLVVKDDTLVFETYLRSPADRDRIHHVQSVTKSVVATTLGIARDRGFLPSLDVTLAEIFPDYMARRDPRKGAITLRHLLTMSSGIDVDNIDFNLEMWTHHHADPLGYLLDKPLYAAPGARFYYRNADPQLLAYALERVTGRRLWALAEAALFTPLGISDYYWQTGPDDGVTIAGSSLHLRPRDLAKLGQLVLDGGSWHGHNVVSPAWVAAMTRAQATSDTHDANGDLYPYGYYWWITPDGFAAWGNGGQFVVVEPAKRLMFVHIALPDTSGMDGSKLGDFLALIKPLL